MSLLEARLSQSKGANFYDDPEIFTFRNAIYHCGLGHFDGIGGVFTREGHLIPQAAFYHRFPAIVKGHPQWVDPEDAKYYPSIDRAIFVGHLHDQYGHLITEFISRIWALSAIRKPGDKLLARCVRGIEDVFSFHWAKEIFDTLGLTRDDFIVPTMPITINELIVPSPAFAEQGYCYRMMATHCHQIGDLAVRRLGKRFLENENIYLTRSDLICGTVKLDNEKIFERALAERGFRIVRPERLSFSEQVSLFRNGNLPTGIVGSAFHTSIFTPNPSGVAINLKASVDANYTMMDGINEAEIDYVESEFIGDSTEPDTNFYETKTISNVEAVADSLHALVSAKRFNVNIANMGFKSVSQPIKFLSYRVASHDGGYIKADPRTGRLTTAEDRFHEDVYALRFPNQKWAEKIFFITLSGCTLKIEGSLLKGPVIALTTASNVTESISFLDESVKKFLTTTPANAGGVVASAASESLAWEKYTLQPINHLPIVNGTRMQRILSLIYIKMESLQNVNYEFYNNTALDLVTFVDRLLSAA